MPFIPNTPEAHAALVTPASTAICRGVSNDGKQCKRTLTTDNSGQPQSGIITIVGKQQAYFCNRHQDQAKDVVLRHTASFARRRALVGRGSMDTLIEQVELLVGEQGGPTMSTTVVSTTRKVPRDKDPFKPVLTDYDEEDSATGSPKPPSPPGGYRKPQRKRPGFLTRLFLSCCCVPEAEEDPDDEKNWSERRREAELRSAAAAVVDDNFPMQPMRARRKGDPNAHVAFKSVPPTPPLPMMYPPKKPPPSAMVKYGPVPTVARTSKATAVGAGLSPATPQTIGDGEDDEEEIVPPIDVSKLSKEQQKLLELIPKTIHPKGLSRLQLEVLKPFSPKDEPGYIYMFWLTDSPMSPYSTPSTTAATTPSGSARTPKSNSDRLQRAALNAVPTPGGTLPKLLFKIGRANNVQRRLHEWTTQCGYNLSLIRYYPHTSASSSPGEIARKVPNCNRIERLIHLELSATPGANPKKKCEACGKTHKEWFEVEASREGILAVDEVIKRWIAFGERSASGSSMSSSNAATAGTPTPSPKAKKSAVGQFQGPQSQRLKLPARRNAATGLGAVKMYNKKPATATTARTSVKTKTTKTTTTTTGSPQKKTITTTQQRRVPSSSRDDDYTDDGDSDWGEDDYRPQ